MCAIRLRVPRVNSASPPPNVQELILEEVLSPLPSPTVNPSESVPRQRLNLTTRCKPGSNCH
ncbi:hypothetical protein EYF80_024274 [Liparis tanakae]|uniref:Uncharacterized protein n=1 Tax=Liparis tanakae TaxID=230148 RepID=A0A4Z2HJM0_9TELE|nr:hypothetical protein EYF80_024274 [Liparis tanakae]